VPTVEKKQKLLDALGLQIASMIPGDSNQDGAIELFWCLMTHT